MYTLFFFVKTTNYINCHFLQYFFFICMFLLILVYYGQNLKASIKYDFNIKQLHKLLKVKY